jgi:hypothetical protein
MGAESDVVDTLSRDAARKIVHVLMQTPASGDLSVLRTRVQAYVRQALVAAVQPPDSSATKAFRLMARGYLPRNPQVFSQRCVGFMLVGEDYLENVNRHQDTVASFLAFNRVARQIARDVKKGDQLEVNAWMRGNTWPPEPGEKRSEITFEVESFRFAGALPRVTKTE